MSFYTKTISAEMEKKRRRPQALLIRSVKSSLALLFQKK